MVIRSTPDDLDPYFLDLKAAFLYLGALVSIISRIHLATLFSQGIFRPRAAGGGGISCLVTRPCSAPNRLRHSGRCRSKAISMWTLRRLNFWNESIDRVAEDFEIYSEFEAFWTQESIFSVRNC